MKFKRTECFLSLFFALAVVFSFGIAASAHDYPRSDGQHTYTHNDDVNILAKDVDPASEDDVKKLTKHLTKHIEFINTLKKRYIWGDQENSQYSLNR